MADDEGGDTRATEQRKMPPRAARATAQQRLTRQAGACAADEDDADSAEASGEDRHNDSEGSGASRDDEADSDSEEKVTPRQSAHGSRKKSVSPARKRGVEGTARGEDQKKQKLTPDEARKLLKRKAEMTLTQTKKTRQSPATKQPPWTEDEKQCLREIAEAGEALNWPKSKIYAQYGIFAQKSDWPVREPEGCRNQLKRMRSGGDSTVRWAPDEVQLVMRLQAAGKPLSEIARAHEQQFGQRHRRTAYAIAQKLVKLVADPGVELVEAADDTARETSRASTLQGQAPADDEGELTTRKNYWTKDEDEFIVKHEGLQLAELKQRLDRFVAEEGLLVEPRSVQAIQTRLYNVRRKPVAAYCIRALWTAEDDDVVEDAVAKGLPRRQAIPYIVKKTGATPTYVLRKWQKYRKDVPVSRTTDVDVSADVPADEDELSDGGDVQEARELRPAPPDGWYDTEYYPSGPSGDEQEGDEEAATPSMDLYIPTHGVSASATISTSGAPVEDADLTTEAGRMPASTVPEESPNLTTEAASLAHTTESGDEGRSKAVPAEVTGSSLKTPGGGPDDIPTKTSTSVASVESEGEGGGTRARPVETTPHRDQRGIVPLSEVTRPVGSPRQEHEADEDTRDQHPAEGVVPDVANTTGIDKTSASEMEAVEKSIVTTQTGGDAGALVEERAASSSPLNLAADRPLATMTMAAKESARAPVVTTVAHSSPSSLSVEPPSAAPETSGQGATDAQDAPGASDPNDEPHDVQGPAVDVQSPSASIEELIADEESSELSSMTTGLAATNLTTEAVQPDTDEAIRTEGGASAPTMQELSGEPEEHEGDTGNEQSKGDDDEDEDTKGSRPPVEQTTAGDRLTVPMSPRRDPTDGASTAADRERNKEWLIIYADRGRWVRMVEATRDHFWMSRIDRSSDMEALRRTYVEREAMYKDDAFTTDGGFRPRVGLEDLRRLLFVATLLLREKAHLVVWLREMWESEFGPCRDPQCCLFYQATCKGYEHRGVCRHWDYLQRQRVYLDRFKDVHDYLLAMTLAVHREASIDTGIVKQGPLDEKARPRYIHLSLHGYGMANHLAASWPAGIKAKMMDHVRPLLGVLTAIILHRSMDKPILEDQRLEDGGFGRLYYETRERGQRRSVHVRLGWACLVRVQFTWVILTDVSMEDVKKYRNQLVWGPKGNFGNYLRRFDSIQRAAKQPSYMVQLLAQRQVGVQPRAQDERQRAVGTKEYLAVAKFVDADQLSIIRAALIQTGIILARGPYGCGKTTLITKMVKAYCAAYPYKRVAIVSETNAAIDEDLARLIEVERMGSERLLRIGVARNAMGDRMPLPPGRRPYYLKAVIEDLKKKHQLFGIPKEQAAIEISNEERRRIEGSQVVVTTLSQLGKERYAGLSFDLVVVDEGAQTVEHSLPQALGTTVKTAVIVGDPSQLFPYSPAEESEREYYPGDDRRHKLRWSAIHSLEHACSQISGAVQFPGYTMSAEFRSHPKITAFLAPFYEYPLRDRAKTSSDYLRDLRLPDCFERDSWGRKAPRKTKTMVSPAVGMERVVWLSPTRSTARAQLHGDGRGAEANNRLNVVEATAVIELLLRIRQQIKRLNDEMEATQRAAQHGGQADADREAIEQRQAKEATAKYIPAVTKTVLVISPYQSQVDEVEKLLEPYRGEIEVYLPLEVRTTDSSQGREADITIVTLVRNRTLGFMRDYPARSLVSLSRSRDYLFLLADHETFRSDTTWARLIENVGTMQLPCRELPWTTDDARQRLKNEEELCRLGDLDPAALRKARRARAEEQ